MISAGEVKAAGSSVTLTADIIGRKRGNDGSGSETLANEAANNSGRSIFVVNEEPSPEKRAFGPSCPGTNKFILKSGNFSVIAVAGVHQNLEGKPTVTYSMEHKIEF